MLAMAVISPRRAALARLWVRCGRQPRDGTVSSASATLVCGSNRNAPLARGPSGLGLQSLSRVDHWAHMSLPGRAARQPDPRSRAPRWRRWHFTNGGAALARKARRSRSCRGVLVPSSPEPTTSAIADGSCT